MKKLNSLQKDAFAQQRCVDENRQRIVQLLIRVLITTVLFATFLIDAFQNKMYPTINYSASFVFIRSQTSPCMYHFLCTVQFY